MKGMMMQRPLRISDILEFGAEQYPQGEIVSVRTEGDVHRYTYPQAAARTRQLAHALKAQGVELGDRVATLVVTVPGEDPVEVPLVAGNDVLRLGLIGRLATAVKSIIWGDSR